MSLSSVSQSDPISEPQSLTVASFYRFVALPDYRELRLPWLIRCQELALCGTILLAEEGLNATLAGTADAIETLLDYLRQDPRLHGLQAKYASCTEAPFARMKVRLKQEIVTLGQPQADPLRQVGTYVRPQDWNALISQPDVLLLDTRNTYETAIGIFKGAQDPQTESFREFPDYVQATLDPAVHRKVAMYCTGGIRCEKASAWMLAQGFEAVYHLEGGILNYLETVPAEQSLWQGECFVFDQRVAVEHGLATGHCQPCLGCGRAVSPEHLVDPGYEPGVSCPACVNERSDEQKKRSRISWQQRQSKAPTPR